MLKEIHQKIINNKELIILMLLWTSIGVISKYAILIFLPLTILLLWYKNFTVELFLGFIFILVLANSLYEPLFFSKIARIEYILLLSAFFFMNSRRFGFYQKLFIPFIPFFVLSLISLFIARAPSFITGLQKNISYILLFTAIPNYINLSYIEENKQFYRKLIYFLLFILVINFILLLIDPDYAIYKNRLRGIFGNPNELGIFSLLSIMLFSVINHYFKTLFKKKEKFVIYFLFVISMLFSESRSSLGSLLIFIFFLRFFKHSYIVGAILFLISLYIAYWLSNNLLTIIHFLGLEHFFRIETLQKASGRIFAWKFAWQEIQKHFFLGQGFDYDVYLFRKNAPILTRLGHEGQVHNAYLGFWLNTGIFGVISFFLAFIYFFVKLSKKTFFAYPVMYAILFSAMFEDWLKGSLNPFTILFITIIAILNEQKLRT